MPNPLGVGHSARAVEEMWHSRQNRIHSGPPNMAAKPTASISAVSPTTQNPTLVGSSVPQRTNPRASEEMWYAIHGGPPPTIAARPTAPTSTVSPTPQNQNLGGPAVLRRTDLSAEWMKQADAVVEVMALKSAPRNPRVKVAILDTGVSPSHAYTRTEGFRDHRYWDFVENSKGYNTLHGTEMLDLVLRMHAHADVYIARVFETEHSSDKSDAAQMARAIDWAIWKEVDVMSISAGFVEDYAVVREAIARANAAGILIFAAAANWGNMNRVAYPAANDQVFCIFASGNLNKVSTVLYNPEPRPNTFNLAFLGNDVDVHRDGRRLSSGTSTATALLAGFVARIIDFSRHRDSTRAGVDPTLLRTRAGMRNLLVHISNKNGRFHCITPWNLVSSQQGSHSRDKIHEVIKRALERVD